MYTLGLTGFPLSHSLSPKLHNAALTAAGLEGSYSLFPVDPAHPDALAALLGRVRSGEIHGLNVTIPHKQAVIPLLDELTETAQAIGAVNTIYMRSDRLIGDNTDAAGFWEDVSSLMVNSKWLMVNGKSKISNTQSPITNPQSPIPNHQSALVLGAGGSARAVVYALVKNGWQVTLAARRIEQAEELAQRYTQNVIATTFSILPSAFRLLINTTPLGMTPHTDTCPWEQDFPPETFVYDLVYNPPETLLMKRARAAGLQAANGLGMLIEQAALAFERWTGHKADRTAMKLSLEVKT